MPTATTTAAAMPAATVTIPHAPAKAEHEGQKRHNAKRRFFHTPHMVPGHGNNMETFC